MIALTYKNPICTEHGWNQGPPPPISIVMETVIQIPQLQWKPSEFFFPHWYCWDPSAMGRLRKEPGVLLTSRWWCKYGRVPKASLTEDLASPGCLTVILLTPIFFFLSYRWAQFSLSTSSYFLLMFHEFQSAQKKIKINYIYIYIVGKKRKENKSKQSALCCGQMEIVANQHNRGECRHQPQVWEHSMLSAERCPGLSAELSVLLRCTGCAGFLLLSALAVRLKMEFLALSVCWIQVFVTVSWGDPVVPLREIAAVPCCCVVHVLM